MVPLAMVVAVGRNRVIGVDGDLPWRLPSDLKTFRALTLGKPIIMGRKTFESIGRPLDKRPNIVITRDRSFTADGIHVVATPQEAVELGRNLAEAAGNDEVMVIGGGQIYSGLLAQTDRIYLSEVDAEPEGDAYFPDLPEDVWEEVTREQRPQGEGDSARFDFVVIERRTDD